MSTANGRRPDNRKDMSREANGLEFPLGESKPDAAETIEIAPGVHWLRMPLPFQLNHINLWLLEDGDGYVVVDTGIAARRDEAALARHLRPVRHRPWRQARQAGYPADRDPFPSRPYRPGRDGWPTCSIPNSGSPARNG